MFFVEGSWKLSELESYEGKARCPRCLSPIFAEDSKLFKCEECDFSTAADSIENLPVDIENILADANEFEVNAESLKEVVDSLDKRGESAAARELSCIVSGMTIDHGSVIDSHTITAMQILAYVENSLLEDEHVRHFAPRIAMLRHKIEKEAGNA